MKITMYGTPSCSDCVAAKAKLEEDSRVELVYRNVLENTTLIKEFLAYRDSEALFEEVVKEGRIGIPFFILEDGTKTFDISELIGKIESAQEVNACSTDGKGC